MKRGRWKFLQTLFKTGLPAVCMLMASTSWAQTLQLTVTGASGGAYRWLVEEDNTYKTDPGGPADPNPHSVNFHKSYMPVVAEGSCTADTCPGGVTSINLDPAKHYFLSVLGSEGNNMVSGAQIKAGDTAASVALRTEPVPTAQFTVYFFNDNNSLNNAPDTGEEPLVGWQVQVVEAGGRYGVSGGRVMQDIFGNPLGTEYELANPADPTQGYLMVDGAPVVKTPGDGTLSTGPDGSVVVKNLAMGKYSVNGVPPPGEEWYQVTTIEGTPVIDAWVNAAEPRLMNEFGFVAPHIFMGFVKPFAGPELVGTSTVTGQVVNFHMAKPPNISATSPGHPFPNVLVGMNDLAGKALFAGPANPETGMFSIPNVPIGTYELVFWDTNLDMVIAFSTATVAADGVTVDLGPIAVNDWFAHLWSFVYYDANSDGMPAFDGSEPGIPEQNINVRWRDGTIYLAMPTDLEGAAPMDEVFPFFDWLVAEVDYARFKPTGMTAIVDEGGPVDLNNTDFPGFGRLNPQLQPENANLPYRTEVGPVLTQGFQAFAGQTNVIYWGKRPYEPGENGGISGVVFYNVTRDVDDPRTDAGQPWEPGIPRVQMCLYTDFDEDGTIDDTNASTAIELCDVDNYPFGWSEGGAKGVEDINRNGDNTFGLGDAVQTAYTDSWDDNLPTNCPGLEADDPINVVYPQLFAEKRCYDGMRNWNQVRPAVFDGGYAFSGLDNAPGMYIVEANAPAPYQISREQDKNVDFGDNYTPSTLLEPPVCVGGPNEVPAELVLFPGVAAPYALTTRPLCDKKQVRLTGGANAAADFFYKTDVPIAAHYTGLINNDLANVVDPQSPNFGEKPGAANIPIAFRDFTGKEITRVYSDANGAYNGLLPSTYTMNAPMPSGVSPAMYSVCINDRGPIPDGNGGWMTDPYARPEFTEACYTLQFMPGSTTYLDTPVLPMSAFASQQLYPLDCEMQNLQPVIQKVTGALPGPYVSKTGGVQQITLTSRGQVQVANPAYNGAGQRMITRNFGFGADEGQVTLNGVALNVVSWTDSTIVAEVNPANSATGQLMVRSAGGVWSEQGITLHVGTPSGNAPIVVTTTIQAAIDQAANGDLVLVPQGTYEEMVILYKNIFLQGAGSPATAIVARNIPFSKLTTWRAKLDAVIASDNFLLPGQFQAYDALTGAGLFANEQGSGILVLDNSFPNTYNTRIDGFKITLGESGGGIFVNAYANGLKISNNHITGNNGSYGGGIRIGNMPANLGGFNPGTPETNSFNDNVVISRNLITENSMLNGPAGSGGGLTILTGSDNYIVRDNLVCGNFTQGSGGGIAHMGFITGGVIENNKVYFNQSYSAGATWGEGGGISIMGVVPPAGEGMTAGAGSAIVRGNTIQGNYAGAGDGGGIRLAFINGTDVVNDPYTPNSWNSVTLTQNVITNNVSGRGGAVSLQDAANVTITLNSIAQNDSTSTAAAEIIAAPQAHSLPLPSGILSRTHTPALAAALTGFGAGPFYSDFSNPVIDGNIIWRNRSFWFDITANAPFGGLLPGFDAQNPAAFTSYIDLGVVPSNNGARKLSPTNGILTDTTGYAGSNTNNNPGFAAPYFNADASTVLVNPLVSFSPAIALNEGGNAIQIFYQPLTPTGSYVDSAPGIGALSGAVTPNLNSGGSTGTNPGTTPVGETNTGNTGNITPPPATTPAVNTPKDSGGGGGGCFINTLLDGGW